MSSSFNSEQSVDDILEQQDETSLKLLAETLSLILGKLIENHKRLKIYPKTVKSQAKMSFSALEVPKIKLTDYLFRIMFYSKAGEAIFITALIFLDRISNSGQVLITEFNIHRLLFTSILVSIKYNEDTHYVSNFYAEIAGITLKELIRLERDFLKIIDFKLYVLDSEYSKYCDLIKSNVGIINQ